MAKYKACTGDSVTETTTKIPSQTAAALVMGPQVRRVTVSASAGTDLTRGVGA
jgi:hypothetical protein